MYNVTVCKAATRAARRVFRRAGVRADLLLKLEVYDPTPTNPYFLVRFWGWDISNRQSRIILSHLDAAKKAAKRAAICAGYPVAEFKR